MVTLVLLKTALIIGGMPEWKKVESPRWPITGPVWPLATPLAMPNPAPMQQGGIIGIQGGIDPQAIAADIAGQDPLTQVFLDLAGGHINGIKRSPVRTAGAQRRRPLGQYRGGFFGLLVYLGEIDREF